MKHLMFLALTISILQASSIEQLWEQAYQAQQEEDYTIAIQYYDQILQEVDLASCSLKESSLYVLAGSNASILSEIHQDMQRKEYYQQLVTYAILNGYGGISHAIANSPPIAYFPSWNTYMCVNCKRMYLTIPSKCEKCGGTNFVTIPTPPQPKR